MKQTLERKLGQRLAITPQMRQALRLLQLSTAELRGQLRQLVESNYMLEMDDDLPGEEWGGGAVREHVGRDPDSLPEPDESLREGLLRQLAHARFSAGDHLVGAVVIDAVDERGYLGCSTGELLETLDHLGHPASAEEVEAVIGRVQRFEPPGVAARSLSECLLLQLEERAAGLPPRDLAVRIARDHLEALARHGVTRLARRLGTTREALGGALALLRTLNPRPGAGYAGTPTVYVTPDLRVFRAAGGWGVELGPGATPPLRINPVYAALVRQGGRGAEGPSLRRRLSEARWLIRSLEHRAGTLLRVARAIVRRQSEFLEHGEERMQPLALRDVASELGLHESTVSRAAARKYVETPRGVFELKYFFSSRVSPAAGGSGASGAAVRARLRKIIEGEEPGRPWSDQRLALDLEQAGFRVARRTVAKYRESMGIPPSSERRRAGVVHLDLSA